MPIDRQNFDELTEADLQSLAAAGTPESLTLEYKRDPYGTADTEKREFLKDISAFANSAGGHLVIGMTEVDGAGSEVVGIERTQIDTLINRLESLARDGIGPRLPSVRIRRVDLVNGRTAIVVRVAKSWIPPHRVAAANHNKYYLRNSGGVHEASVEELRNLFNLGATLEDRIRAFHLDRIAKVCGGQGPILIAGGGRLFLHLVPLTGFTSNGIDPAQAYAQRANFTPISSGGATPTYNIDGFMNYRGGDQCHGYTQVFRNGAVEATKSSVMSVAADRRAVYVEQIVFAIARDLRGYFDGLSMLDVRPPIALMVSLQGVGGAEILAPNQDPSFQEIQKLPNEDVLPFPNIVINEFGNSDHYLKSMRPIFDTLWNAAGFAQCSFFGPDGEWQPPRR